MKSNKWLIGFVILFLAASIFSDKAFAQTVLITPDSLYLGQIPIGSKNVRQFKIFNLSTSTLQISSFSINNDTDNSYKILNNPGSVSLGQLQSIILQIEFTPSDFNFKQAELVIQSNASTSPDRNALYGRGLPNTPALFERVFGDEENNIMNSVRQTSDGGYILGGSTIIPGEDFTDMYLVKTDVLGEIVWEKVHGNSETESVTTILQTGDGSYMVFGQTNSIGAGKFDFYLVKFSSTGDVIWEKTYGGNKDEKSADMIETPDGGYMLLGSTLSFGDGLNADVYVVKVNSGGTELWNKRFGGSSGDAGDKLVATQDGNYAVLASTASFGAGGFDLWLIKLDINGNELWNKTFGGNQDEEGNGITELQDGSLVMVGFTVSFGAGAKDIYIVKTNSSGTELWNKVRGGLYQDVATNIVSENDGIIYTTIVQPQLDSSSTLINKDDLDGNEIWQSRFYGGANDLTINSDSHIIIAGSTGKYGNNSEVYFLNANEEGVITSIKELVTDNPSTFKLFNNYPNPFNPTTTIKFSLPERGNAILNIYNINGKLVKSLINSELNQGYYQVKWDGRNGSGNRVASGVYFYKLTTGSFVQTKKMILLK